MKVYPFIEAEKQASTTQVGGGNLARASELLKVSRSAHAATTAAGGTARQREDAELTVRITTIHAKSDGTYWAPRTHTELAGQGLRHGCKRIAWLMREAGLRGRTARRWRKNTIPDPAAPARPDLIGSVFTPDPFRLDQRWCGDITYIRTWQGWLYLATVIDIASRTRSLTDTTTVSVKAGQLQNTPVLGVCGIDRGVDRCGHDVLVKEERDCVTDREKNRSESLTGSSNNPGDELDPGSDSDRTRASAHDAAAAATNSDGDVASGGGEQPAASAARSS